MRVSYAVGAWYAESAPQETQKFASIGKKLDLQAFSQGFTDKINNRLQLPQAKLSPNSTARNSSWKPPCCPRMKKRARSCWRRPRRKKARSRCRTA
ncbi:hypothetical protein WJ968_08040 [Achromobacter xylosoxidans]